MRCVCRGLTCAAAFMAANTSCNNLSLVYLPLALVQCLRCVPALRRAGAVNMPTSAS